MSDYRIPPTEGGGGDVFGGEFTLEADYWGVREFSWPGIDTRVIEYLKNRQGRMTPETAISDIAQSTLVFADAFRVVAIKGKLCGNEYGEACRQYAGYLACLVGQTAEPLRHVWRSDGARCLTGHLSAPLRAKLSSPAFSLKFNSLRQAVQAAYPPPFEPDRILRDPGPAAPPAEDPRLGADPQVCAECQADEPPLTRPSHPKGNKWGPKADIKAGKVLEIVNEIAPAGDWRTPEKMSEIEPALDAAEVPPPRRWGPGATWSTSERPLAIQAIDYRLKIASKKTLG